MITRRELLAGGAAVVAAGMLPLPVRARSLPLHGVAPVATTPSMRSGA